MTSSSIKTDVVGFVIKRHQAEAAKLAIEMAHFLVSKNKKVLFSEEAAETANKLIKLATRKPKKGRSLEKLIGLVKKEELPSHCSLIVVLGGDGTFLSIARLMKETTTPLMGVNMGKLGFLTEIKRSEALASLRDLVNGKAALLQPRALLEVTLKRKDKTLFQGPVVNDAVISKGAIARIIDVKVSVNKHWAYNVRADGLIVSTPTGSTAYSLAAGGPILEPSLEAIVLSPICPHSLTQRPVVLSDENLIEISLSDQPGSVLLTLDGQDAFEMFEGDTIMVRRFKAHSLKLISSPNRDYFALLREKLKFGARD